MAETSQCVVTVSMLKEAPLLSVQTMHAAIDHCKAHEGSFDAQRDEGVCLAGIICPLNRKQATSLKWWGLHFYFWGGVGYCLGGIQLYW